MTHRRQFLLLLRLVVVAACLTSLSACKSRDHGPGGDGPTVENGEQFHGEPKVTADVHYATGQVFESKIATLSAAGKAEERQITQLRTAALSQYAAGLKLDANHTPSLHRSAALLSAMERHDQAIAMWERYVTATGRTPNSLVNLGLANEMARREEAAEAAYREATERDPSHKPAHVNLGILLARQGQLQPAQAALSAVLPPAAVHWHLGVALQTAGRMEDADQQFRAAAALDPAYARRPAPPSAPSASVRD